MKPSASPVCHLKLLFIVLTAWLWAVGGHAASNSTLAVLYRTGFEASEGYNTVSNLVGQKGWLGAGSGGNGIGFGLLPGPGQQAYIGYAPPQSGDTSLFVYQPRTATSHARSFRSRWR